MVSETIKPLSSIHVYTWLIRRNQHINLDFLQRHIPSVDQSFFVYLLISGVFSLMLLARAVLSSRLLCQTAAVASHCQSVYSVVFFFCQRRFVTLSGIVAVALSAAASVLLYLTLIDSVGDSHLETSSYLTYPALSRSLFEHTAK